MNWAILIPVIAANGLEVAEKIWQLAQNNSTPTQADWDALKALAKVRAVNVMRQALINSGIDPESEEGKRLLALATTGI